MTIRMDLLIQLFAQALDMVEIDFLGVTTNHGKRVAVLCAAMGRHLGMSDPVLSDLVSCALLHDNALTEYILMQNGREEDDPNFGAHCEMGQRNAEILPFNGDISGYILYHHEQADGKGLFKLSEGSYPLGAELIAVSDMLDAEYHLEGISLQELPSIREKIKVKIHSRYTARAGNALLDVLDAAMLASLQNSEIAKTVSRSIPVWTIEMGNPVLVPISELISRIIDYKSKSTGIHTQQIANRSWLMAEYYGYDMTEKIRLYLAAALHDIGKLAIPAKILEKPGPLDDEEYEIIKTHVSYTRSLLGAIDGLELIAEWASSHHEKLDGSGYPRGSTAANMDFNSRLLACIDVYQAICEERPYHYTRGHSETMAILYKMAEKGAIDPVIVKDMDLVMAQWSGKDVEMPRVN